MAKRTISKGSRLKLRDKYDREFFVLITGLLFASPVGFFYKNFETLPPKVLAIYAVGILLIAFCFITSSFSFQKTIIKDCY